MRSISKRFGLCVSGWSARSVTGLVVLTAWLGLASSVRADTLGGIDFAVFDIGGTVAKPSQFQIYQSGTVITGNVGQGPNTIVTHGIDATVQGSWFYDPVNNCSGVPCASMGPNIPVSVTGTVTGGFNQMSTASLAAQALSQSSADAALTPDQTFPTLSEGQTVLLHAGQNVVKINNSVTLKTAFTMDCTAASPNSCSVVFQLAATGTVKNVLTLSGVTMNLIGNIKPSNVVWNLPGNAFSASDVAVQITSSANVIGTFLAPNQGMLVDSATVRGEVIGGGNGALLSIHSSSKVIPEPPSLLTLGLALAGFLLVRKKIAGYRQVA